MDAQTPKQSFFCKYRTLLILIGILLLSTAAFLLQATQKVRYHEDEIMTFTLANSTIDGWLHPNGFNPEPASVPFMDAMTVHKGNGFNYAQVWRNQTGDVHPPLYYAVVHTICSFFPDTFSPLIGYGINLFFMLLCVLLIYRCSMLLTKSTPTALFTAAFFGVCPAVLEIDMFLRMYIMVIFLCLALVEWMFSTWDSPKITVWGYIRLPLIIIAGALTHYYFIFFLGLFSVTYVIFQLFKTNFIKSAIYTGITIVSGFISYLIFPSMLFHIFSGYRGTEAFDNIVASNGYFYRLLCFANLVDRNIFSFLGLIFLVVFILMFRAKKRALLPYITGERFRLVLFLLLPSTAYFLFVAKTAAYLEPRYISLIYPYIIMIFVAILSFLMQKSLKSRHTKLIIALLLILLSLGSTFVGTWSYSYKGTGEESLKIAEQYSDCDCLYLCYYTGGLWKADCNYQELLNFKTTTFMENQDLYRLPNTEIGQKDRFILCIGANPGQSYDAALRSVLGMCENVDSYTKLYEWNYTQVYLLYAE